MYEEFSNNTSRLIINDDGIIYQNDTLKQNLFYPYGSITEFKVGLMGLSLKGGSYTSPYIPAGDQKKKLKELAPTVLSLNVRAPKCSPRIATTEKVPEKTLEKTMQSIINFFAPFKPKKEDMYFEGIATMFSAMDLDEKLLYGCRGDILYVNRGHVFSIYVDDTGYSTTDPIILITDKRFYYAGNDGDAINTYLRTGSFALQDVRNITIRPKTYTTPPAVLFMVNADEYELTALEDAEGIKEKLEAGIKACLARVSDARPAAPATASTTVSVADELKKFKELLDMGIITQEEFDAKKKQLLGL